MMKRTIAMAAVALGSTVLTLGCSAQTPETAPSVGDDTLEPQQLITSVNANGTWTANAATPNFDEGTITGPPRSRGPPGSRERWACVSSR